MARSLDPARFRLLLLTLAGFVVRAAFLILEPATSPVGDERTWIGWADNLLTAKVGLSPLRTHMIFHAPLYPFFLALTSLTSGTLEAVKWAQALVGAAMVPAVALLGWRVFGPRVGWIGAIFAALYPELVWFSAHFWSEIVYLALLWWAFERLVAAFDSGSAWTAAAAGALWALAILARETTLYFTPVAAAWLVWGPVGRPRRIRPAAAFVVVALLVTSTWTWRNWMVHRAFVPVSTAGGQNLFQGNCPIPRDTTYEMVDAVPGRIPQYRYAMGMGIGCIRDRQPTWVFEKLREQMPNFWEADSLVLIHVKRGAYGPVSPASARVAALVVLAPYLLLLPFFAMGLALAVLAPERRSGLLVVFLVYYNALHVITHGFARYRLPVIPIVFLLAAWGFVRWRERSLPATGAFRLLAAGLVLLLALLLGPSVRHNLTHAAFGLATDAPPSGNGAE